MRLVFVGSPPFATPVLERLLAGPFRPLLVVTPPDRPRGRKRETEPSELASLARAHGVAVDQPPTVKDRDFLGRLRALEPEVVLVCAYGEYLDDEFRSLATRETLNVHPSLLPRHRGASPVQAALRAGDRTTGVAIQRVAKELDAGDLLVSLDTQVGPDETAGELGRRLAVLGGEAAARALAELEAGTAVFVPQDPARVTVCRKLAVEDGVLRWSEPARALHDLVRAMNPWPLARATLPNGRELLVLASRVAEEDGGDAPPGTLLRASDRLVVQTGRGALELLRVKPAGKGELAAAEFLRGARLAEGERLA